MNEPNVWITKDLEAELIPLIEYCTDFCQVFPLSAMTLHCLSHSGASSVLRLLFAYQIPNSVLAQIQWVPIGRGMAGEAQRTGQVIHTCNLPQDTNPVIRSGARQVRGTFAGAYPLGQGSDSLGVLGISFATEQDQLQSNKAIEEARMKCRLMLESCIKK